MEHDIETIIEARGLSIPRPCSGDMASFLRPVRHGQLKQVFWIQPIQALVSKKHYLAAWCTLPAHLAATYEIGAEIAEQFWARIGK